MISCCLRMIRLHCGSGATALIERLARLRLTIHPGAQPQPVTEGVPFLGFIVYPEQRRLKRRKGLHFRATRGG